ncbi:MAG: hypothetical protein JST21_04190 [Bacteroidetes bacterium]|nr:hypothetical protein [Bacteroidota bacterium]
MRKISTVIFCWIIMLGCNSNGFNNEQRNNNQITGTWQLISGTLIEKNNTTVTDYTLGKSFIKIINATHFAFMGHDLNKGKDSTAFYSSGGGRYDLKDSSYTEHLEYCNDRQWEGNSFDFIIHINNDTLVQQGVEKIDSLGINRINIEKYVRLK